MDGSVSCRRQRGRERARWEENKLMESEPGADASGSPESAGPLPATGDSRVDEAVSQLEDLAGVPVAGQAAGKPATQVAAGDPILITGVGQEQQYASRGGAKLAGALAAFPGLRVAGRRCLDAGASTGGFTDVLLRSGAAHVIAADVGYGQLAWALRTDERVTVLDRVNVRQLRPE